MLLVTESAKGALKKSLDSAQRQPGQCVRLMATQGGQFGLALDVETPGDEVVKHGETKILVLDSETAKQLEGLVLDYRDSEKGGELTLLRKEEPEETGR
ncbi:MAG: hypothetical protein GTO24_14870 [candidate division Zixibacteria bacterium]|nr:hypothetical protein [candidate division Zixibacteria bacterium]